MDDYVFHHNLHNKGHTDKSEKYEGNLITKRRKLLKWGRFCTQQLLTEETHLGI